MSSSSRNKNDRMRRLPQELLNMESKRGQEGRRLDIFDTSAKTTANHIYILCRKFLLSQRGYTSEQYRYRAARHMEIIVGREIRPLLIIHANPGSSHTPGRGGQLISVTFADS